jgi:thiopeptide-type bacteriocin biosynthesis protein
MTDSRWLALHCHTPEPFEPFLREVIAPAVRLLLEDGTADRWFFIRYWEGGPHIRLRLHVHEDVLAHVLEGLRRFTAADLVESPYEPEYERYGGPAGVAIAERQFELSSRVALELIESEADWSYETILGIAIQLHLGFGFAVDVDLSRTRHFLAAVAGELEYMQMRRAADPERTRPVLIETFRKSFDAQSEGLVAMHQAVWDALVSGAIDDPLLLSWVRGNAAIVEELRAALHNGRLLDARQRPLTTEAALLDILTSYVHMTNNRLGMRNRDEAFTAYVTARGLGELRATAGVLV